MAYIAEANTVGGNGYNGLTKKLSQAANQANSAVQNAAANVKQGVYDVLSGSKGTATETGVKDPFATGTGSGSGTGGGGGYGRGGGGSSSSAAPAAATSAGYKVSAFNPQQYTAPTLQSATSQADYIQSMYDANRAAEEANLQAAYEANLATLEHEGEKIDPTYNAAADQASVQAAINRANFNEAMAANGLNTGAGSQAQLSQNNALLRNISSIRQAQADARNELNFQRAQMETQYRNAIQEALAKNNLAQAQALYEEAKRVDESMVATAAQQAQMDFNAWNANQNMAYNVWNAKNQLNWNTWNKLYGK